MKKCKNSSHQFKKELIFWIKTCNHISLMHNVPKSHFFVFEPNYGGEHYLNSPFNIANSFCRCQVLSPLTITLDWNMQSYSLLILIDTGKAILFSKYLIPLCTSMFKTYDVDYNKSKMVINRALIDSNI